MTDASPGLFTADASGKGQGAILNQDGSVNTPNNPAQVGSVVALFGTGEGATNPSGTDGKLAGLPLPMPLLPVQVLVGGVPADLLYASGAPTEVAGVLQINVRVPSAVAAGRQPVILRIGQNSSQPDVYVVIG